MGWFGWTTRGPRVGNGFVTELGLKGKARSGRAAGW